MNIHMTIGLTIFALATHGFGKHIKQKTILDKSGGKLHSKNVNGNDIGVDTTGPSSGLVGAGSRNRLIWLHRHRQDRRNRRHKRIINDGERACAIKRNVIYKAKDEFGHEVQIAPYIGDEVNATRQFIYETYCAENHCDCAGIDAEFYESTCQTDRQLIYARVIKAGKLGWAPIKVRVGCACIVEKKRNVPSMLETIEV